jgi:mono/diheme cytochrome c family protein
MLGLQPANLRTPAVQRISDRDLVARIMHGAPLEVAPGPSTPAEDLDVRAIAAYLPTLATPERELLRVGRFVYEGACAACHGAYGQAEGVVALWLGVPNLVSARERHTNPALARISVAGIGTMPALVGAFDPGEVRALLAYIRHLSDGFRLYDTYCAACHGEDGQGLYSQDFLPPATVAPPLRGPYEAPQILHMLRRERRLMPHLRDVVDEAQVAAIVAYLRTLPSQEHESRGSRDCSAREAAARADLKGE